MPQSSSMFFQVKTNYVQRIGDKSKDYWALSSVILPLPLKRGEKEIYNEKNIGATSEKLRERSNKSEKNFSTSSMEGGNTDQSSIVSSNSCESKKNMKTRKTSKIK